MDGLRIEGLGVERGGRRVLEGLTMELARGEYVALVGPSGAGKTTLLRALAGLEPAASGRVYLGGRELTRLDPGERGVAMVFQGDALFPDRDVGANIGLPLELARVSRATRSERVGQVLALLGIEGWEGRWPATLSGGERQRVALARALVTRPGLLLMDEPMASLDWPTRVMFREGLRRIPAEEGCVVVHVTHDPHEALSLGDRLAVLEAGCLRQLADAGTVYDKPAHVAVAGIFGWPPMNWFPVGGQADPEWLEGRVPGGAGRMGIRPEDVMMTGLDEGRDGLDEKAGEWVRLGGCVTDVIAGGREWHVEVTTSAGRLWVVRGRGVGGRVAVGDAVQLGWRASRMHWFDRASGLRLAGC